MNPAKAPQVVGGLLDAEAPDDFVNNLILSVRSLIPVEGLCAEVWQPFPYGACTPLHDQHLFLAPHDIPSQWARSF